MYAAPMSVGAGFHHCVHCHSLLCALGGLDVVRAYGPYMPAGCATLQHLIYRICGLLCTLLDRGCAYVCIHARMHASCAALRHCMGSPSLLWPCWQEMQHIYMALCLMAVLPCSTVQDSHTLL